MYYQYGPKSNRHLSAAKIRLLTNEEAILMNKPFVNDLFKYRDQRQWYTVTNVNAVHYAEYTLDELLRKGILIEVKTLNCAECNKEIEEVDYLCNDCRKNTSRK